MAEFTNNIQNWHSLKNGLRYTWLVDYAAYSAYGTFELSDNDWEKRDLIINFKGNSELTTEIDHQNAVAKAIEMVGNLIKEVFGKDANQLTLVCIPAAKQVHSERRFKAFSEAVCAATGMENAYDHITYEVNNNPEEKDTYTIEEEYLKGKDVLIFDDIIASGGSVMLFADKLSAQGAHVIGAIALGKKISDGYDRE